MPSPPHPSPPGTAIHHATTPADIAALKALFTTYHAALGVDISYQNFAAELAALPGAYAPPSGALLLARATTTVPVLAIANTVADADATPTETPTSAAGTPLGCVALRPLPQRGPRACELKRLFVVDAQRGSGLGRALAEAALAEARARGYGEVLLDSLAEMGAALRLYAALGFEETGAYYATPLETRFFVLRLEG